MEKQDTKVRIIMFGGVRENGKNMYAVEVNDDIYILDCGLQYPENELLGIDVVIPDWSYLRKHKDQVKAVFLTHGHADAIGALPYFVSEFNVPVYGSSLTIALARLAVNNYEKSKKFKKFHTVTERSRLKFNDVNVSFFKTTHNIPESLGIVLKTNLGQVVYTGDFKFDQTASKYYQTDLARLGEIGKRGVLALLSDSAGAEQHGYAANENDVYEYIYDQFKRHNGRIIVANVAANILRIQEVLNAAIATHRKVVLMGKDLENIVQTAIKLKKLNLQDPEVLVSYKKLKNLDPEETVILETGKMGEPIKALQRMATGEDKFIQIQPDDLVLIATTTSTAMETTVAKTRDLIFRAGGHVEVISDDLQISGHGSPSDLQLMINLMKPKYLIPVQGEYRVLNLHAHLAEQTGMPSSNIFITEKGDSLVYDGTEPMHLSDSFEVSNVMIDGIGVGDIGNIVLRDRKILSEDGVFVAVITIDRKQKKIISEPKITSRGFVYVKSNRDLIKQSSEIVKDVVRANLDATDFDWGHLKQEIREKLSHYLFEQTRRRPVVLPIVMEVNQNKHRLHNKTTVKAAKNE